MPRLPSILREKAHEYARAIAKLHAVQGGFAQIVKDVDHDPHTRQRGRLDGAQALAAVEAVVAASPAADRWRVLQGGPPDALAALRAWFAAFVMLTPEERAQAVNKFEVEFYRITGP